MLLTFLSAVLFYLSFPNMISMYGFWPCIWFFAVPLLFALKEQPLTKRLGYAAIWGFCAYGLMSQGLLGVSPAGFLIFVLGLSLQTLVFACLFRSTGYVLADIVYIPCIWCVSEFIRNGLLGGFSFYISHAQAFCPPMLQLYAYIGCLGMSFIIFLVNVLIFMGVAHRKHRALFISAAGIIFLGVLTFGSLKKTEAFPVTRTLHVSVIQADISPQEKASLDHFNQNIARHMRLTERSFGQEQPDLVIWPETAFPDDLLQNDQWRPLIFALAQRMKADILLGIAPIIEGKEYNSAILINDHLGVGGLYHKQALVPFAETMPLEAWGIHWGRGYHFSAGHKPGLFAIKGGFLRFGVVICSESAHPAMVRQLRRSGARFLVELSNDGWFTDKASYMLHAQAAVMRAVEEHMWVIRAANTGWSFAVAPDGTIHTDGNLKLGREGFGNFDIMVNSP